MFYSHEILTSPEHGVATIWLVATLGSRSIAARKLNRKAILDVDVPEACKVIINPQAPMALRLQGSLLYGVSRVYNQQCGYTLLDAQAMHDKMISMLKLMPGGGLDPSAGKTKPTSLILPYDPAFLPETSLPGIGIDLSLFNGIAEESTSQQLSIWTKSPATSQSSTSHIGTIELELPEDDLIRDAEGLPGLGSDINSSAQKGGLFGRKTQAVLEDEEGVLLQPDFEFDDNGNIVEFDASKLSPHKRKKISTGLRVSEGPVETVQADDAMVIDEEPTAFAREDDIMDLDAPPKEQEALPEERVVENEQADPPQETERRLHQLKRQAKAIIPDGVTTLRNTDLARWNDEYEANMAQASKLKQQNKMQTISKKNAAYWVFGKGIGAVGIGLGAQHAAHPLTCFSGKGLYDAFWPEAEQTGQKRTHDEDSDTDADENARRVRARDEQAEPLDVEVGRHAPSSVLDDHSFQMPWNITASIQSSRRGQRFGSVSEFSTRGLPGSSSRPGSRPRGRLTSASPLAGRGYLDAGERHSLDMPGNAGDELEDFDITAYLESELAADSGDTSEIGSRRAFEERRIARTLDQESLNFWDFIKAKLYPYSMGRIEFSKMLPPTETSRAVATQGLMNVLTLATKGAIDVSQEPYEDKGPASWGTRYHLGEIWVGLAGIPSSYDHLGIERPRSKI